MYISGAGTQLGTDWKYLEFNNVCQGPQSQKQTKLHCHEMSRIFNGVAILCHSPLTLPACF